MQRPSKRHVQGEREREGVARLPRDHVESRDRPGSQASDGFHPLQTVSAGLTSSRPFAAAHHQQGQSMAEPGKLVPKVLGYSLPSPTRGDAGSDGIDVDALRYVNGISLDIKEELAGQGFFWFAMTSAPV